MGPSTPFIRRPIGTTLLTFGLAAAGIVGLHGGAFLVALFLIWWRDHANVVHPLQGLMRRIAR